MKSYQTNYPCSGKPMSLLYPSSLSYNNFVTDSRKNVTSSLLISGITPSNTINSDIIYSRKELKAKMKYIGRKLIPATQKNAWIVFEWLVNNYNESSAIFPGHKYMSKKNRYSERTSKSIMKALDNLGLVFKIRRGNMKSNLYQINWSLVYERLDLLEGYDSRVKCKTCTLTYASKEAVIIMNNDEDNFIEKEILAEKKYEVENYTISKNLSLKLEKEGIRAVAQYFWRDKFRIIAKDSKPWNGDKEWDIVNANFAFSGFIHRERAKQRELGSRYICPIVRKQFKEKPTCKQSLQVDRVDSYDKPMLKAPVMNTSIDNWWRQ